MAKTFNLGLGMIVAVPPSDVYKALDVLRAAGHFAAASRRDRRRGRARCALPDEAALIAHLLEAQRANR